MHGWPEVQTSRIVTFTTSGDVLSTSAVMLSGWSLFVMTTGGPSSLIGLKE